ncbi:uncharacterized protein F4822DRAFT_429482 [Hypoxylon trugodes]|uniref:uncharacterized protein n=1 Tax=Hypoxylon trugodes TaxID=326681 RepID=UPI00219C2527|nr:uncharacterized protein F4822DRAFT_429482 [Hypoxylon trugodes]KAI1388865.1 hypothetical protein F4822DRAFT_429482 [Hypoxylon trugodes]
MPLRPPVSAVAGQAMKTAFDQLDQTVLPEDSHNFSTITLENVKKSALVLENQLAARKSLRNMRRLLPLFSGLEHYARVVEVLCNGTPYLSWIWAPITLVLQLASEYVEAFEKIIKGEALSKNPDFQQTLAVFYADILQFHRHAYIFVRRKSWKLFFLTSWGRFERRFDNILDDMKRHGELVDLQANAHGVSDIRQVREDIKSWRVESRTRMNEWNNQQTSKQLESIVTWLKSEESGQLAILETILIEGDKYDGTCSWALNNTRIKCWLQSKPDPPVLWLQGSPGSGKSVLASQIMKFMRSANMFLISHFCTDRYASSTTYDQILRSILIQLLRKDSDLVAYVYEHCMLAKKPTTVKILEKLLGDLFTLTSRGPRRVEYVWIVIDGLNECDEDRQGDILTFISRITSRKSGTDGMICKTLICSRNSPRIAGRLRAKQTVSLTEERSNIEHAIREYVSQRLRRAPLHNRICQLELATDDIGHMGDMITDKANGMFLYARLVLDYLSKNVFFNGKEMKAAIDELPKELFEFYRKILTQVLVQLDQRSVERIRCIFGWIGFTRRPLKKMELLSALTFSRGDPNVTNLVPKYVLDICGTLVEERPDTTLAFIHISVKEFLQSPSSSFIIRESQIMTEHCLSILACLTCGADIFLGNETEHTKALRVVKGIHGFHVYATEFWTEYLLDHVATPNSNSLILDLASALAQRFGGVENAVFGQELDPQTYERLKALEGQPQLKRLVEIFLNVRSSKGFETNLMNEFLSKPGISVLGVQPYPTANSPHKDYISMMLSSYQEVVRLLLRVDEYPDISADDLDLFKRQFRRSAFTCRLSSCPQATEGFVSEELRRQHEIGHTKLCLCTIPECRFPPFTSIRNLENHMVRYHRPEVVHKPIRRVGQLAVSRPQSTPKLDDSKTSALLEKQNMVLSSQKLLQAPEETTGLRLSGSIKELPLFGNNLLDTSQLDIMINSPMKLVGFRYCRISGCAGELTPESLTSHYWVYHHKNRVLSGSIICGCRECHAQFSNVEELQTHYVFRHTSFFCNRCLNKQQAAVFISESAAAFENELRDHFLDYHSKLVERWKCGSCMTTFNSAVDVDQHARSVHHDYCDAQGIMVIEVID